MTSAPADQAVIDPPALPVPAGPVKTLSPDALKQMGNRYFSLFGQYRSDRRIAELRWLRNQRQYLGILDPEIEKDISANRSKAYPRITRIKCISVLSRLMNLMFPGNEDNWTIQASPSPDMSPADVQLAVQKAVQRDQEGGGPPPNIDEDYITAAVQRLADERADKLRTLIKDQLQELGGDQTYDYVALNRQVIKSGIMYGPGILRGPYARQVTSTVWGVDPKTQQPKPRQKTIYKPLYEWLSVWDFYPDMAAKTLQEMDGYFTRKVMTRAQVRALAERTDFLRDQIISYLNKHQTGNYRPQEFETELRALGVKINVNEQKPEATKYEVIAWHGPVSGQMLRDCGCEVADDRLADDIDAELWLIDSNVIKATINPWVMLDCNVKTLHTFLFDEDDTSPVGQGLPNVMRDSQMSIVAAARMLMDNASVVCGPNLELNTALLRMDQDLTSISAYKIWYRDDDGLTSQYPAVRNVEIDAHLEELMKIIELWMNFADAETFVGPATGGDMSKGPSEPFRTAAGASMLRGDAALPFKEIVRSFDQFTQSVIESLIQFNRKFNKEQMPEADYDVIARGATSLIAKEVRGAQLDQLVPTLTQDEMFHVDARKLAEARFRVRDMEDMLLPEDEAKRKQAQAEQAQQQQMQQQQAQSEAQVRKLLSDSFKNIAQGNKNSASADATNVKAALDILEKAITHVINPTIEPTQEPGGDPAANPAGGPG